MKLFLPTLITLACTLATVAQDKVVVPVVDLGKDYPEKVLKLSALGSVRYIPLETKDESLIKSYNHIAMDSERIVITDRAQNQVFIFDKNGKFLNRISRCGGGPKDYQSITLSCVDFGRNYVYIWDNTLLNRIKAYNFDGAFVKQINVASVPWPDQMYVYDDSHLIIHCDPNNLSKQKVGNIPYMLINTSTGKVTPLNLKVNTPVSGRSVTYGNDGIVNAANQVDIYPLTKNGGKVLVSDFSHPVVFQLQNGKLNPIIKRSAVGALNADSKLISAVQNVSDRYILFRSFVMRDDKSSGKVQVAEPRIIMYDRANKSVAEVDIFNDDLNAPGVIETWNNDLPDNTAISVIPKFVLDKRHSQGKLSGAAERLYSTLDDEANDVLMILTFDK